MARAPSRVKSTGADAGSILVGIQDDNWALCVRVFEQQPVGRGGRLEGPIEILRAGGDYSQYLVGLVGQHSSVDEVIRQVNEMEKLQGKVPKCTHILNANALATVESLLETLKE